MPRYDFNCKLCDTISTIIMSVNEYKESEDGGDKIVCEKCGKKEEMFRVFSPSFGKIWKGREELLSGIKEDARKIVKKIKSGNQSAIREIYGDEN